MGRQAGDGSVSHHAGESCLWSGDDAAEELALLSQHISRARNSASSIPIGKRAVAEGGLTE